MKYSNLYDMHTHSIHSFDGNHKISKLCESAVKKGAKGIAITDHCDIDGEKLNIDSLCTNQISDIDACIDRFGNSLEIIKGLEIGQAIYRKELTESLYKKYEYDFVLGSIHNLENMEDFYFLDYKKFDFNELMKRYFSDLIRLVDFGMFDSLAHLTYPFRYIDKDTRDCFDYSAFDELTDEILSRLAKKEKALEINTSGLFLDGFNDTLPSERYIRRFKELGGKYITVGSDSHFSEKVFGGIEQGYDIARACGFDYITIYKKHEPMLVEIK